MCREVVVLFNTSNNFLAMGKLNKLEVEWVKAEQGEDEPADVEQAEV